MNDLDATPRECLNENCVRHPEPGERYCAACGLERSLFLRDLRPRRIGARPAAREARRGSPAPAGEGARA